MTRPALALVAAVAFGALPLVSGCAGGLTRGRPSAAPPGAVVAADPAAALAPPPPEAPPAVAAARPTSDAPNASPDTAPTPDDPNASDDVDDDAEPTDLAPRHAPPSSPVLALRDAEIDERVRHDPASLGSISVGRPSAGILVNGVQMPADPRWELLDAGRAWGTRETVDDLTRIIGRVNEQFHDTQPVPIGHISAKTGGHLSPHVSHQAGRDVDVGYYYRSPTHSFTYATEQNLDVARTWALVRAAVKETDVEMIFIDQSIQRLLADYAVRSGEPAAFVDEVFQVRGKNARAPVRHIKGHATHVHFRFFNPVAEELGRRTARFYAPRIPPPSREPAVTAAAVAAVNVIDVKAHSGDTLVTLAKRYGTTVEEIQRLNNLKGNAIRAGMSYRIPQKAPPKAAVAVGHGPGKGGAKGGGARAVDASAKGGARGGKVADASPKGGGKATDAVSKPGGKGGDAGHRGATAARKPSAKANDPARRPGG